MKEQIGIPAEEGVQEKGKEYYPSEKYVRYEKWDNEKKYPRLKLAYSQKNPDGQYRFLASGVLPDEFIDSISNGKEIDDEELRKLKYPSFDKEKSSKEYFNCDVGNLPLRSDSEETTAVIKGILGARDKWYKDVAEVPASMDINGYHANGLHVERQWEVGNKLENIATVFGNEVAENVRKELIEARPKIILEQVRIIRGQLKMAYFISSGDELQAQLDKMRADHNLISIPDPDKDPEGAIKWFEDFAEVEGTILKQE